MKGSLWIFGVRTGRKKGGNEHLLTIVTDVTRALHSPSEPTPMSLLFNVCTSAFAGMRNGFWVVVKIWLLWSSVIRLALPTRTHLTTLAYGQPYDLNEPTLSSFIIFSFLLLIGPSGLSPIQGINALISHRVVSCFFGFCLGLKKFLRWKFQPSKWSCGRSPNFESPKLSSLDTCVWSAPSALDVCHSKEKIIIRTLLF